MSKHYFGTDGIRGVAGEPPLDPATVFALGLALGDALGRGARVVMGMDTRESGPEIASVLAGGLQARGVPIEFAGVLPTPAVAFLATNRHARAGVMISASHNPYQDNGIKIFGGSGYKLPDQEEAAIERALEAYRLQDTRVERARLVEDAALRAAYLDHLVGNFVATDWSKLRVVLDCAHGAAHVLAAPLARRLGFEAQVIAAAPDGRNINAGVGALHPHAMGAAVRSARADVGIALDGDADRAIFVDSDGSVVNGDCVLWMAARDLEARGELNPRAVVGTVMTNLGLERAFTALGIELHRTAVGDKYVLERMRALGAALGGEPSGHVIFSHEASTGDGLLTALHCLALMARTGKSLQELCAGWTEYPQRIVNVPVVRKPPLADVPPVQAALAEAQRHFRDAGRILVRYSGTENLVRVMVEAESRSEVDRYVESIAAAVRTALGSEAAGKTAE